MKSDDGAQGVGYFPCKDVVAGSTPVRDDARPWKQGHAQAGCPVVQRQNAKTPTPDWSSSSHSHMAMPVRRRGLLRWY